MSQPEPEPVLLPDESSVSVPHPPLVSQPDPPVPVEPQLVPLGPDEPQLVPLGPVEPQLVPLDPQPVPQLVLVPQPPVPQLVLSDHGPLLVTPPSQLVYQPLVSIPVASAESGSDESPSVTITLITLQPSSPQHTARAALARNIELRIGTLPAAPSAACP
jgi:hypothetical protein